jgi:hypothetical protein
MFKKFVLLFSAFVLGVAAVCAFAKDKMPTIKLYADMNNSKVLADVPWTTQLVPIIRKKGWVKVGLRPSGQVGWINVDQYRKAQRAFYKPNIQTVYINSTEDSKGKPTVNVIAYRNGQKLSEKQAKAFYEKMIKQQRIQQGTERDYWKHFNRMMRFQQHEMNQMMQDDFMFGDTPPIIVMPGPVLIPGKTLPAKKAQASH